LSKIDAWLLSNFNEETRILHKLLIAQEKKK